MKLHLMSTVNLYRQILVDFKVFTQVSLWVPVKKSDTLIKVKRLPFSRVIENVHQTPLR